MTPRGRLVVGLAVLASLAAGCGGGAKEQPPTADPTSAGTGTAPSESPSTSPSPTSGPTPAPPATTEASLTACSKIWVVGNRLPLRYQGCEDAGKPVPANGRPCVVGHDLVVYRQRFYAMATGKIFVSDDLAHDPGYAQMRDLCKNGMNP